MYIYLYIYVCVCTTLSFEPLELWHKCEIIVEGFVFSFQRGRAVNCTQEHYPTTVLSVSEGAFVPLICYRRQTRSYLKKSHFSCVYCTLRWVQNTGNIEGMGGREKNYTPGPQLSWSNYCVLLKFKLPSWVTFLLNQEEVHFPSPLRVFALSKLHITAGNHRWSIKYWIFVWFILIRLLLIIWKTVLLLPLLGEEAGF